MHYTLCDCILDLFQNSVEANSSKITLDLIQDNDSLKIKLQDNGKGMDSNTLNRIQDPFYTDGIKHKHRKVGLGIPFLIQTTEMTQGSFSIESQLNKGTELNIVFNLKHWDTPPIGNIVSLLLTAMTFPGDYELEVNRKNKEKETTYTLSRLELKNILGDLTNVTNMILLEEFIASGEIDN